MAKGHSGTSVAKKILGDRKLGEDAVKPRKTKSSRGQKTQTYKNLTRKQKQREDIMGKRPRVEKTGVNKNLGKKLAGKNSTVEERGLMKSRETKTEERKKKQGNDT